MTSLMEMPRAFCRHHLANGGSALDSCLQHASPDVSEKYYNLSPSVKASRRHAAVVSEYRTKLGRRTEI